MHDILALLGAVLVDSYRLSGQSVGPIFNFEAVQHTEFQSQRRTSACCVESQSSLILLIFRIRHIPVGEMQRFLMLSRWDL